jgi:hypothetical protein
MVFISPGSQALAMLQSSFTVLGEIPISSAACSSEILGFFYDDYGQPHAVSERWMIAVILLGLLSNSAIHFG